MQNRLLLIGLLFFHTLIHAQVTENSRPPSRRTEFQAALSGKMPTAQQLPTLDAAKALQEDSQSGQTRFAAPVTAQISCTGNGAWHNLPNGDRVWLCAVQSAGAKGLSLLFERFKLPEGARFYAYGADMQRIHGAYTTESCLSSGKFLIGVIRGEVAYMELYEPAVVQGQSEIQIQRVDVAYDLQAMGGSDFGEALPCNININCTTGANWQTEKKGVARILMVFSNGEGWCSGTLIANTANTYDPYFLTAHHCQIIASNPDFSLWRFDFDYEAPSCANPGSEPVPHSVLGCEKIANRAETDFMLLKLNPIPSSYDVYFNGWNKDGNATSLFPNTVSIHHPIGDLKKITVDTHLVTVHPNSLNWGNIFGISPANSHWKSVPDLGSSQEGSSGSPLFDKNKRIVGQLHGGSVSNTDPCIVTGSYFGRFNVSWDQGATPQARLKDWLDPNNTGVTTKNGYARPVVPGYTISGNIKTHWGQPLKGVRVTLTGGAGSFAYTDTLGNYHFDELQAGLNYTIRPSLDTNDLDGVTTYDLVLISKHIIGSEPLDSPWKIIAADINQSASVTTFDIVETRKVILGINTNFAGNTSWRFLPAFATFSNPDNPFQGGLPPDSISVNNLQAPYPNVNFKAIKVGDVNNTATGQN